MVRLYCISVLAWALLISAGPPPAPAPLPASYGESAAPAPAYGAPQSAAPPPPAAPAPVEAPAPASASASASAVAATPYMGPMMISGYTGGPDFDPALLGGRKGFPGLRARLNTRLWQYASMMLHKVLDREIQRARLPDIVQSTQPTFDGCIALYNAYVSRYRSPCKVAVYPKPPNKIRFQMEGLDIGITGNIAGMVNVIIPINIESWMPCGIVEINIHGLNLGVDVEVVQGPCGPMINVCECAATVEHVDICIRNGGLLGSLFNSFARRSVSKAVEDMLPSELCKMLRKLVMEQVNTRSNLIPQAIALTQLAAVAGGGLNTMPPRPDPVFCEQQCGMKMGSLAAMGAVAESAAAPQIPTSAYGGPAGAGGKFIRSIAPFGNGIVLPFHPTSFGLSHLHPAHMARRDLPQQMMDPRGSGPMMRNNVGPPMDPRAMQNGQMLRTNFSQQMMIPRGPMAHGPMMFNNGPPMMNPMMAAGHMMRREAPPPDDGHQYFRAAGGRRVRREVPSHKREKRQWFMTANGPMFFNNGPPIMNQMFMPAGHAMRREVPDDGHQYFRAAGNSRIRRDVTTAMKDDLYQYFRRADFYDSTMPHRREKRQWFMTAYGPMLFNNGQPMMHQMFMPAGHAMRREASPPDDGHQYFRAAGNSRIRRDVPSKREKRQWFMTANGPMFFNSGPPMINPIFMPAGHAMRREVSPPDDGHQYFRAAGGHRVRRDAPSPMDALYQYFRRADFYDSSMPHRREKRQWFMTANGPMFFVNGQPMMQQMFMPAGHAMRREASPPDDGHQYFRAAGGRRVRREVPSSMKDARSQYFRRADFYNSARPHRREKRQWFMTANGPMFFNNGPPMMEQMFVPAGHAMRREVSPPDDGHQYFRAAGNSRVRRDVDSSMRDKRQAFMPNGPMMRNYGPPMMDPRFMANGPMMRNNGPPMDPRFMANGPMMRNNGPPMDPRFMANGPMMRNNGPPMDPRALPASNNSVLPRDLVALPVGFNRQGQAASRLVVRRGAAPTEAKATAVAAAPPPQYMNPMCQMCMMSADDPAGLIRDFAMNLNLKKLNDIFLSVQLLNTAATWNDYCIDLTGEFSPGGQGGTPFGPFPTMWPKPYSKSMVEAIVTDYTINSLLYWMHKKGFLSFRIGPETPKIGELLKTTCSEEEEGMEDVPPETDEETPAAEATAAAETPVQETADTAVEMQPATEYSDKAPPTGYSDKKQYQDTPKRRLRLFSALTHRFAKSKGGFVKLEKRIRRQGTGAASSAAAAAKSAADSATPGPITIAGADGAAPAADPLAGGDSGSLADLGICLGDILPAVKEKYPNKKIAIMIHTIRAPSIIFSSMKGGSARIDLQADADLFIDGTMEKVGTITVCATVDVALQMRMNRIYGMGEITDLKLLDMSGSLGLPQDALDNLGTLGKELIAKVANDALAKGIPLNLSGAGCGLPLMFTNTMVMIIDHGLYVAGDVMLQESVLGMLTSGLRDIQI